MGIFNKILGKSEEKKEPAPKKEKEFRAAEKKPVKKQEKKAEPKKKTAPSKARKSKKEDNLAYKILFEPIISEKSTELNQLNKYVFKVDQRADKNQVREAVEGYYGVNIIKINVIKISSKKRIMGRTVGYKQGYKKAIVTLQQGDTIGIAEGV